METSPALSSKLEATFGKQFCSYPAPAFCVEDFVMRHASLFLPIVTLSLSLGSCSLLPGGGGDGDEPTTPETPQATAPAPTPATDAEIFPPATAQSLNSVLIPSTDPDARRRATAEGRPDPFADLPIVPQVTLTPPPAPTASGAQPGTGTANGLPNPPGAPGAVAIAPPPAPLDFSPVLPSLPEPTAANNTIVSGVVQLNGIDYVMIKADGEQFSRYVKVGDYVANGQVLVKEITFNRGVPVVLLEQYGRIIPKKLNETSSVASNPENPGNTVPTFGG
ncbi:MAG: hypothetical protein VKJ86_02120 [Synechococcus sp.]|nr:hypothetical protein [Synechococcus sp.]